MLKLPTTAGDLDVLNRALGAPPYDDLRARAIEVEVRGTSVWIASLEDLIAMKRATARPRDLRDIADLTGPEGTAE
jgi:predicted nucleotidyltransferase